MPSGTKILRVVEGDIVACSNAVDLVVVPEAGNVASAFAAHGRSIPTFEMSLPNHRIERRSPAKLVRYRSWVTGPLGDDARTLTLVFGPIFFENSQVVFRYLYESLVQLLPRTIPAGGQPVRTIGLPILQSGAGGLPFDKAAGFLMRGLIHWLAIGLPLDRVDFVERDAAKAQLAAEVLHHQIATYRDSPVGARSPIRHDVFLSYSHEDISEAKWIARTLRKLSPRLDLFWDVASLRVGGVWQHELYSALDASSHVLALLSPHYLASQFCVEEYNIAVLRDRQDGSRVLFPVLVETVPLPGYMEIRKYIDCTPRDPEKLEGMCEMLASQIEARHGALDEQ